MLARKRAECPKLMERWPRFTRKSSCLPRSMSKYAMPSLRSVSVTLPPESRRESRVNSMVVFGVRRIVLPSSSSISTRPSSLVQMRVPCVTGRFRMACSKPSPVRRSICTSPWTSLRRTIRACESARPWTVKTGSVSIRLAEKASRRDHRNDDR